MTFEQINKDWNAEPNAPEVEISVVGNDVIVEFFLNAFLFETYNEGDKAILTFRDCSQYRYGSPNEEGFYIHNQSRYKQFGVKWGEFYVIHDSDWKSNFPNPIEVSSQPLDELKHFLFYFRDGTFECIAKSYEFKKCE